MAKRLAKKPLLAEIDTERAKLDALLAELRPRQMTKPGITQAGWSVKDVLGPAVEDLFISDRDGQPFKVRYKVPGSAMGSSEPVIFESAGVEGKYLIGFLDMRQEEFDAAESERLFRAKPAKSNQRDADR